MALLTYGAPNARKKAIPDIIRVRQTIAEVEPTGYLAFNCVGVWAPHTHWEEEQEYLVEENHPKGYFLRALDSLDSVEEELLGISFLIIEGELVTGEYARKSVFTSEMLEEYPIILEQMKQIAKILVNSEAGLTLLHRFKKTFSSANVDTTEHLATQEGSLVSKRGDFPGDTKALEPVIWSAYDAYLYLPKCLHGLVWLMKLGRKEEF